MRSLVLALSLAALPADAEAPMSAAEFEAYVTGKTLTYAADGRAYGVEEYLAGRRVRWSFLDGECQDGEWYPAGDMICFVYENIGLPQCWTFYRDGAGLRARFMNDPSITELYETRQSDEPMQCLGPKVGV